jgi:GNAT superfamily N-acetyltransferase
MRVGGEWSGIDRTGLQEENCMRSAIVRRAKASEVPAMAGTLQAAFDGYPWTDWAFPAQDRAARQRDSFALYLTASKPSWFLGTVGTLPDLQGCGLGRAVLTPVLRRCDRDGLRAVLDTSTYSNVRLYSRLGFETTAEVEPGDGAPRVWVMTRAPETSTVTPS